MNRPLSLCSGAAAQLVTVSAQKQVSPEGVPWHEAAAGGSQGQWLYPVYISKKNGGRTCYTHSVFIRECLSDLNMNRAADAGDVDLFWEAFDEAAPAADVTDDGHVNSDDVDEFVDVYSDVLGG